MSRPYVLPRPLRPLEDESLASLVTRNAATYGFENPLLVLNRLGPGKETLKALVNARPDASLASLLALDLATLRRISAWNRTVGLADVGGREIRRVFLHLGLKRSCPACLAESLHHRALWDVIAIGSCHRHGGSLTSSCPGCGKPPRWYGFRLDRCGNDGCTFDLRRDTRADIGRIPHHVRGLCDLYDAGLDAVLPELELDFGKAVEVTYMLGSHIRRSGLLGRPDAFLRRHPRQAADLMEAGWGVLHDWPDGFDRMLDGFRGKADTRGGRYGLRREFGGFAKWLSTHVEAPWATALRDGFANYLSKQMDLRTTAKGLRRYGSPARLRNQHMTLSEAAVFLAVSPETMAELADREELYLIRRSGAGAPSLLRADLVQALKNRKQATLTKDQAVATLGVGRKVLRRMLETGLLSTVADGERVTHFRLLLRSEVETIVEKAYRSLKAAPPKGKLIPLLFTMGGRRDLLDVLEAVLDGRIRARGIRPGEPGLRGLLFDSREIEDILAPERATLTLVAAGERLELDIESVREWAKEGFLTTVGSASRYERGRRVTEDHLGSFKTAFVTSGELGKLASTSGRWAAERMEFLGYPSLCASSVTKLYRRSDITPEVVARLRTKVAKGNVVSVAEAKELVRQVGLDVEVRLGLRLRKAWSGFSDPAGQTYVQMVVGRRQRSCSRYVFRFNPAMRTRLSAVDNGWLVLALMGFDSYLLVPWACAEARTGSTTDHRHHIRLTVDAHGQVRDPELKPYQQWISQACTTGAIARTAACG